MKSLNFNHLARGYDFLARLVFGSSLLKAQVQYLTSIPPHAKILILGGGTGLFYEYLKVLPEAPTFQLTWIEPSKEMNKLFTKNQKPHTNVIIIEGTESDIPLHQHYDAILLFNYLDLFTMKDCEQVLKKILQHTTLDTIWLIQDFEANHFFHHLLLRVMYFFFKLTTSLQTTHLPPWENILKANSIIEIEKSYFYGRFIKSSLLKKI